MDATNGTTSTTYNPGDPVPREQMAAFTTRTMDQSLKRGSRRAALNQYWTTQGANNLALTTVGNGPQLVQSDGADVWVPNSGDATVSRVRASDGKLLEKTLHDVLRFVRDRPMRPNGTSVPATGQPAVTLRPASVTQQSFRSRADAWPYRGAGGY